MGKREEFLGKWCRKYCKGAVLLKDPILAAMMYHNGVRTGEYGIRMLVELQEFFKG